MGKGVLFVESIYNRGAEKEKMKKEEESEEKSNS